MDNNPWNGDLGKIMDEIFKDFSSNFPPPGKDGDTKGPITKTIVIKRGGDPGNTIKNPPERASNQTMSLDDIVGLDNVKELVKSIVDHYTMMKVYKSHGIKLKDINKHMVFTGNPGTGKTTVARILANMLSEKGVIRNSTFIEVGRGDLVASYVGQTAPKVTSVFDEASGGILFIDEAYSLAADIGSQGGYGKEAISTIIMEMENRRDDVIVIFAGYKDEMEEMLDVNPGMKSRIAFYVDFPDYTADEMYDICNGLVKENSLTLSPNAKALLKDKLEDIGSFGSVGNGRFARNVIEKSILAHSSRLVKDIGNLKKKDLKTLTKSDISVGLDDAADDSTYE